MIQRIQSVYLFLAGLIPAFCVFLPLAHFRAETGSCLMRGYAYTPTGMDTAGALCPWGVLVCAVLSAVVAWYALGAYKNRPRQMRLCTLAVLCNLAFYVAYVAHAVAFSSATSAAFSPTLYAALPILAIVCATLARRAIKHDEELVRSADRLR